MKDQVRKVYKAMTFAMEKHGEQKRKYTNSPYWNHLAEVSGLCSAFYDDYMVMSVAWLHDVLEDTKTTEDELICEFDSHLTLKKEIEKKEKEFLEKDCQNVLLGFKI